MWASLITAPSRLLSRSQIAMWPRGLDEATVLIPSGRVGGKRGREGSEVGGEERNVRKCGRKWGRSGERDGGREEERKRERSNEGEEGRRKKR